MAQTPLQAPLTGSLNLVKSAAGNLILNGASTYTGTTTISAGKITNGIANALPVATSLTNSGTLDLAGFAQQVASIVGSGIVTDSAAAAHFTINNSGADTFAGTMTGSLNLVKSAAGTLTLSALAAIPAPQRFQLARLLMVLQTHYLRQPHYPMQAHSI